MFRLVTCPPHYYIKMFPQIFFWIPFWIALLLNPILEPLLDAHDFFMQCVMQGNSISNMGMLVNRTCYYSGNQVFGGCYNPRHVTKRDVLLLATLRYLFMSYHMCVTMYVLHICTYQGQCIIAIIYCIKHIPF